MKSETADTHMQNLAKLSDELYGSIQHLNTLQKGTEDYNSTLEHLRKNYDLSGTSLDNMIHIIKSLGENSDVTRDQLQNILNEEEYRNEQIAKESAEYRDLFQNDINGLAASAYGNLLAQNKDFQQTTKENAKAASYNVDNYQFKALLEKFEGGKTWGFTGINDKELMKYYAKYVEKWSEDEIKKAQYEKGRGEGTLTSGDKTFSMDDEDMRRELYQALMSLNLAEGLDKDGQKAYDDTQIQKDINGILKR